MQILCIYSGVSPFEQKLDYVFNVFQNTLNEIGVKVETLDIAKLDIPYFNGTKQPIIENIFNYIENAQGIILATTAQRFAPNGAMQVFLEHLDYNLYNKQVLNNKPCLSIITSTDDSEYMAGNYINMLVSSLGGTPLNNMLIGKSYLTNIELSEDTKETIEKYAEDYYRAVRQNRKFFTSSPFKTIVKKENTKPNQNNINTLNNNFNQQNNTNILSDDKPVRNLTGSQVADLYKKEIDNTQNIYKNTNQNLYDNTQNNNINLYDNNLYKNNTNQYENNIQKNNITNMLKQYQTQQTLNTNNNQSFNTNQNDEEINNIAKLLGQKYEEERNLQKELTDYVKYNSNNISPSISTLKQKTQSLYHYFQPQLATGINITMQISISGKENFNGFFVIKNGECTYTEGIFPSADVTIISDSAVWEEVLNGKCTLQKAFMLGRLKVKGNFVVISKFEQFFKII